MNLRQLAQKILLHLPRRRRRRQWKYVSPRRRAGGMLVLALILLLLYAGWYFTHDSRIRRQAKLALEGLTGADVDVDAASFSLFEGIRLQGVRVRIREDPAPFYFFTAREVVLRYDPWTLLTERTLEPTEIVCIDPVVNLEHNQDTGISNAERLFQLAAANVSGERTGPLPQIRLTNGLLRSRVKQGRQRSILAEERIDCMFRPVGPDGYSVTVMGPHGGESDAIWAEFDLDLASGRLKDLEFIGTHRLFRLLPPRYHDWLQRYEVAGDFELVDDGYTDPERDRYEIALRGFSLRLPETEGGLRLQKVTGRLRFSPEGVMLDSIQGVVPDAGDAHFKLSGEYGGLKKDSPFMVTVTIEDFSLPEKTGGQIGKIVSFLQRHFQPEGKANLTLSYQRLSDGEFIVSGEIQPKNITMTPDWFPLKVHNVSGRVTFDKEQNYTVNLRMQRRGPNGEDAQMTAMGTVHRPPGADRDVYDITVRGEDVPLDKQLRDALPQRFQPIWDQLKPAGVTDARVRVFRPEPDASLQLEADLILTGKASAEYVGFPYPLVNLTGRIELRGDRMTIPLLESERSKTLVQIRGGASGLGSREATTVSLQLDAKRLPLDDALLAALPERARNFLKRLNATGQASHAEANITRRGDQPTQFRMTAALDNVAFRSEDFPYDVKGAGGELIVTQDEARVRKLRGSHGDAVVQIDGRVSLDPDQPTYAATLRGENIALDKTFHDALPKSAQETWASLDPAGRADLLLDISDTGAANRTGRDYRLVLTARGMSMRYRDFPYPFRGITGRAIITPGRIVLQSMQARHGRMTATLSGTIDTGDDADTMVLTASIKEMSIDKELLDAVPADLVPLMNRFQPGGRMNAEINKLTVIRQPAAATPADEPATLSQTPPATDDATPRLRWLAEGSVAFRDINFDLGFGARKLTGIVSGKAGEEDGELGMNANVRLEQLQLGKHHVRDIRGQVMKLPESNVMRIDKLEGRAYDGVLVGQASIRLANPVTYKLSLEFEGVDLAKLFNAGEPDRSKWIDVSGHVAGPLVLSASGGKKPTRQATGELVIRDAKMYELPVILGALQIIYLQLPGEGAFNEGSVKYVLRENTLTFREIYLTGKAISVLGSGTYDLKKDDLKLTFLTGPPGKLQPLDELTMDVLRALSNTLVEIRVSGPLKKPKMDTVPLSPVETILRRLVSPSLQPQ